MNNAILLLSPVVNVVVTALFAGIVLRQYLQRHRIYQLYWSIGLVMAFVATLAYVLMIVVGPTSSAGIVFFRVYYILGGALVPAWLGLGSIALVASKQAARICFVGLCVLSILAAALIAMAGVNMGALAHVAGTPGTGILQPGLWLITIIILNSLGVLAVVGVAVYSGWKLVCCWQASARRLKQRRRRRAIRKGLPLREGNPAPCHLYPGQREICRWGDTGWLLHLDQFL